MQLKTEYLENQSRRNNIRVSGIPEAERESWEDSEAKVKAVIKEKLQINVDIERAHRVDKRKSHKKNTNQPRTIVCRLRDWKQREAVIRKARKIKPYGLYVSEDLAPETLQKREAQISKLKATRESGKIAYFILDRLKSYSPWQTSLNSLPFYDLDEDEFQITLYEFATGGYINYDPDILTSLNFKPLLCESYKYFSLCKDLDPDSNFFNEIGGCEYYIEESFNMSEKQNRLNLNSSSKMDLSLSLLHASEYS